MPADLEAPALPRRYWSWQKLLFWLIGISCLLVLLIFTYDGKLEPYDDLLPLRTTVPGASTNGYEFLRECWQTLPDAAREDEDLLVPMIEGRVPWDDELCRRIRKGREKAKIDLRSAIAMPEWLVPPLLTLAQVEADSGDHNRLYRNCRYLKLEALVRVHAGDFPGALLILRDLQAVSVRHLEGSSNVFDFFSGVALQLMEATLTCDLLDQGKPDAAQLEAMEEWWQHEPDAETAWRTALANETAMVRDMFRSLTAGAPEENLIPGFHSLHFKKNQTLNRYHQHMRVIRDGSFKIFPSLAAAKVGLGVVPFYDDLDKDSQLRWMLNPNSQGKYYAAKWSDYCSNAGGIPKLFFIPRAMVLRLALYRWRRDYPEAWPMTLAELVPQYLSAVPRDPWNGEPLRWDPHKQIIFAVGSDWNPNLPSFPADQRTWFAVDAGLYITWSINTEFREASPGLRMVLPPWVPPVVPKFAPKSKAAASRAPAR